jgi:hypothetical protein
MYDPIDEIVSLSEEVVLKHISDQKKRKAAMVCDEQMSYEKDRTCETFDECVYLGEGDFACMKIDGELVIVNWIPQRIPCDKWTEG